MTLAKNTRNLRGTHLRLPPSLPPSLPLLPPIRIHPTFLSLSLPVRGSTQVHVPKHRDDISEEHAELEWDDGEVDEVGKRPDLVVGLRRKEGGREGGREG